MNIYPPKPKNDANTANKKQTTLHSPNNPNTGCGVQRGRGEVGAPVQPLRQKQKRLSLSRGVQVGICRDANPRSYFIEDVEEIDPSWFVAEDGSRVQSVGICGATSTPMWLLEKVASYIERTFA